MAEALRSGSSATLGNVLQSSERCRNDANGSEPSVADRVRARDSVVADDPLVARDPFLGHGFVRCAILRAACICNSRAACAGKFTSSYDRADAASRAAGAGVVGYRQVFPEGAQSLRPWLRRR